MESAVGFNSTGTLGAFQIGVLVSYVLFGVMNTQTYIYFGRFPNDSTKLKALVAFVWVCELADVLCVGNSLYIYTISNYAQPERISGAIPKSLDAAIPFSGIIIVCGTPTVLARSVRSWSLVQGFFAFRIYTLSKKLYIPIIICALSLVRLAVNTTIFITSLHMVSLSSYKERWEWLYTVGWSISAVDDLGITVILVIVLCRKRTHAFEERTVALVDKLILWTIETGLLSSASGIITMICFLTMKGNCMHREETSADILTDFSFELYSYLACVLDHQYTR
ncbi:hypothetical protein B0H19DRAFT_663107 [Mycena capillaripes]|nr:hypothetical protein B0H19DRAFT_663107 [Mycena capillaripes]